MEGNIYEIKNNSYGFIYDSGGNIHFFHKSNLTNCTIHQLEEGDAVEFDVGIGFNGKEQALDIRKKSQASPKTKVAYPGVNPSVSMNHFNGEEQRIIRSLGRIFYVTNGGSDILIGTSTFKYCLIKPTEYFCTTFQLSREIVVVFADYVSFETRALDAAANVYKRIESKLRLDRGLHILICHDDAIEEKLAIILKDRNVNQIVIPFTYSELSSNNASEILVKERFKKYLFDRDLFEEKDPIKDDLFFFGRRDFVHDIVSKCKNCTTCGVFGLRRSGKTSLLYAVKGLLAQQSYPTVFIPCESDLKELDWQSALCKVVLNVYKELNLDNSAIHEQDYSSKYTTIYFEEDMDAAIATQSLPITLMFDEIEHITFGVTHGEDSSNRWLDGEGFISFWNTIKGYYTKNPNKISIIVAGTNPMINEEPVIGEQKSPNPMHHTLSETNQGAYLPSFTNDDTRNMVNTLGGYMGIQFDEYAVSKLTSDCGGHPYLMRLLCSFINKYIKSNGIKRPAIISKSIYDKAVPEFEKSNEATSFYWMILNILMTSYPKEYNTLKVLALDGDKIVSQIQNNSALSHLIGYGLVEDNQNNYAIKYSTIARFLRGEYRFEQQDLSIEEQKAQIFVRTNDAEIRLRKLVKNTLLSRYGAAKAQEAVLITMGKNNAIDEKSLEKAHSLSYAQLFDTSVNKMYFTCLEGIILDNYSLFKLIFDGYDEQFVRDRLSTINFSRRCPDHSFDKDAENWSWDKFEAFRKAMSWLEDILDAYD